MRALVASPNSEEHVELREVPDPTPSPEEVVVGVQAISLNRGEVNRLAMAQEGAIFGWDFAGNVIRPASSGDGPQAGARVVGFTLSGAWAERVAITPNRLAQLPDDVMFASASALPVAGLTALRILRRGGLLLGKRVLVTGAAGGVGRFAVQLGARSGAHVTGIVGSPERAQGLQDLGAEEIVTDLADARGPFDLILESVGGSNLAHAFELVAPGGTIVTFGNSSREETHFNVSAFYNRVAQVQGFSLLSSREPQDFGVDLAYLASLVAAGALDPQIGLEKSWRDAPAALAALRERKVQGKAVLHLD